MSHPSPYTSSCIAHSLVWRYHDWIKYVTQKIIQSIVHCLFYIFFNVYLQERATEGGVRVWVKGRGIFHVLVYSINASLLYNSQDWLTCEWQGARQGAVSETEKLGLQPAIWYRMLGSQVWSHPLRHCTGRYLFSFPFTNEAALYELCMWNRNCPYPLYPWAGQSKGETPLSHPDMLMPVSLLLTPELGWVVKGVYFIRQN